MKAADLFAGAGGTSQGAEQTGEVDVVFAVNHWDVAVKTHSANFPHAQHINSRLDMVNPSLCGKIDLLFASPECTHHSRARGGKPTSDQQRSGAWDLMRWVEHHRPQWLVVENVAEFEQWGPVHNGRPMKSRRGKFFEAWIAAIEAAGYSVDWRLLNAADYGAATSRERLFVIARKGRKAPVWPEPRFTQEPGGELPGLELPRWRAAAEIIDWGLPCPSIFNRKRPLADKTLLRIEAGLRRFCGPFVAQWDNKGTANGSYVRSVDRPMHTLTTKANSGVVIPFQYQLIGRGAGRARDVSEPVPTMIATRENHGVVMPFQVVLRNNQHSESVDNPLGTVCTSGAHHGLAMPYMLPRSGLYDAHSMDRPRARSLERPLPTIIAADVPGGVVMPFIAGCGARDGQSPPTDIRGPINTIVTKDAKCLVTPLVMSGLGGGVARSAGDPTPTLTANGCCGLITVNHGGFDSRTHGIDEPLRTITNKRGEAVMVPFLAQYYGTWNCGAVDCPMATITTKERISLVQCQVCVALPVPAVDNPSPAMRKLLATMRELGVVDIGFRMLSNPELAAAQGFPADYVWHGNKSDVTRQIGNSVSPNNAQAITEEILAA